MNAVIVTELYFVKSIDYKGTIRPSLIFKIA